MPSLRDQTDAKFAMTRQNNPEFAKQVDELLLDHMRKDRNLELAKINGGNGSVLPIPATFVLNREGVVTWRFVNVDYRQRAEPDEIMAALKQIA